MNDDFGSDKKVVEIEDEGYYLDDHCIALVCNNHQGHGFVLAVKPATVLANEVETIGTALADLGLDDAPWGVSIWEGTATWAGGEMYYGMDGPADSYAEYTGAFRDLTALELAKLLAREPLW